MQPRLSLFSPPWALPMSGNIWLSHPYHHRITWPGVLPPWALPMSRMSPSSGCTAFTRSSLMTSARAPPGRLSFVYLPACNAQQLGWGRQDLMQAEEHPHGTIISKGSMPWAMPQRMSHRFGGNSAAVSASQHEHLPLSRRSVFFSGSQTPSSQIPLDVTGQHGPATAIRKILLLQGTAPPGTQLGPLIPSVHRSARPGTAGCRRSGWRWPGACKF